MEVIINKNIIPPLDKQSAAYKLFHYHFLTYMRMADHIKPADLEIFGLMLSNDNEFNTELSKAKEPVMLTPAEMAYVVAGEGKGIILGDPKDAVVIYHLIDQHLRDWREVLYNREVENPPLQGLYEFDTLAGLLILIARGYGLLREEDRQRSYVRRRSIRAISTDYIQQNAKVTHSGNTFLDILRLSKEMGADVYKFRNKLAAIKTEARNKGSI